MKRTVPFIIALCVTPAFAQEKKPGADKPAVCAKPLSLVESRTAYKRYKPQDAVKSVGGYGIYSETPVNAEFFDVESDGSVNTIFTLSPPNYWISIRREFTEIQDLKGSTGLEVVINVISPLKRAGLRVTVSDVASAKDFKAHGNDRMWIYDLPGKRLKKIREDLSFKIPWKKFAVPQGDGFRTGTSSLGLQVDKIVAYEINLIGKGETEVRIVSVGCYAE
jgi:hypothetical protein